MTAVNFLVFKLFLFFNPATGFLLTTESESLCFLEVLKHLKKENVAIMFDSGHKNDELLKTTRLLSNYFSLEFYNVASPSVADDFLSWKTNHFTVVADIESEVTRRVLNQMSGRKIINGSRPLIMFGDEKKHRGFFEELDISVNSKIPRVPKGRVFLEYIQGNDRNYQDNLNKWGLQAGKLLAEMFNFKMHLIRANIYGHIPGQPVETWPGITRMVRVGDANFSICGMVFVLPRVPVLDNGFNLQVLRQRFIFRHPKHGRGVKTLKNPFIRPLDDETWLSTAFISALVAISLYLFLKFDKNNDDTRGFGTTLMTISMICQQDVTLVKSVGVKVQIIIISFLFTSFMLLQLYSGSIMGALLTPTPRSITDMEKLIESDLEIVVQDVPTSKSVFLIGADESGKRVWHEKIENKSLWVPVEEGVKYIRKGYAYFGFIDHSYDLIRQQFTPTEIDELQEVKPDLIMTFYFPVAKYSPFKEPVRIGVLRLIEHGINNYLRKRWTVPKPVGIEGQEIVKSVFYLLLFGFAIATLIVFIEMIVSFYQIVKQKKMRSKFIGGRKRKYLRKILKKRKIGNENFVKPKGVIKKIN